jgi:hypothetical protein
MSAWPCCWRRSAAKCGSRYRSGMLRRSKPGGHAMPPYALDDEQLAQVWAAAAPLPAECRAEFMQAVATALAGQEIGPGVVYRITAAIQRQFFEVPRRTASYRDRA